MLGKNTLANYIGQGYTTIIGIVILPLYLRHMGSEEFGLIGYFALLTSWLQMLTFGLTPTLARLVAVYRSKNQLGISEFRNILRSIELIILLIGLITALSIWLSSNIIAENWIKGEYLKANVVATSVTMMGIIAAFRWGVSLYSSGMAGMEQQVWLNSFNILVTTLRFIGGLIFVIYVSPMISAYFFYQLVLSTLELSVIGIVFYKKQPEIGKCNDPGLRFSMKSLRTVLPFTLATAYTGIIWIIISQLDKLILSNILSLSAFGFFSFIAMLSNGVNRIGDPINQAILPRLTFFVSRGDRIHTNELYRKLTQFLAISSLPASLIISFFSYQLIFLLSGNKEMAEYGAPILFWYALGNGIMTMSSLLFTLQTAYGNLRLHVINGTTSLLIQTPILAIVAFNFDVTILAITWFTMRMIMFAIFSPIVHAAFHQGSYANWMLRDIGLPLFGALLGLFISISLDNNIFHSIVINDRLETFFTLFLFSTITYGLSAIFSSEFRMHSKKIFFRSKNIGDQQN